MNALDFGFFGLCTLFILVGGVITVGARNPIRGALGLMGTIVGVAGMYLMLAAEFLAAVQIMVYAGAVVVLFLFVIMLLGPSSMSGRDTRTWSARYLAAAVFLLQRSSTGLTAFPRANPALGTIEGIGRELFTTALLPFELSSALLLIAVVGAVAIARGKQVDPTTLSEEAIAPPLVGAPVGPPGHASKPPASKESAS